MKTKQLFKTIIVMFTLSQLLCVAFGELDEETIYDNGDQISLQMNVNDDGLGYNDRDYDDGVDMDDNEGYYEINDEDYRVRPGYAGNIITNAGNTVGNAVEDVGNTAGNAVRNVGETVGGVLR